MVESNILKQDMSKYKTRATIENSIDNVSIRPGTEGLVQYVPDNMMQTYHHRMGYSPLVHWQSF